MSTSPADTSDKGRLAARARGQTMAKVHEMPDRESGDGLTTRQRRVLEVIRNSVDRRGYPPSLREIGEAVGLQSPSSVSYQLLALERKGYLRKDPNRPRAIEVLSPSTASDGRGYRQSHSDEVDETGSGDSHPTPAYVPVLGQIAAGVPITAEEVVDRSEEHTSELQSRHYLVCRLLLEKKTNHYSC